jgi:acyl-coenzyme A thioesterase PaaI-like protein
VFVLTSRFEIELPRPVAEGEVRAVARVADASGRRVVVEGELHVASGKVIGRGRGEFVRSRIPLGPSVHHE